VFCGPGRGVRTAFAGLLVLVALLLCASIPASAADRVNFHITRQSADKGLVEFARQARLSVLFPTERINQVTTNPLQGEYEIAEALAILLRGTGLSAEVSATGVLTVRIIDKGGATTVQPTDKRNWLPALIASLAAALVGHAEAAQETPQAAASTDADTLEEVVVTAEKRTADLQKTSISIAVKGGDEMRAEGKLSIQDILDETPGVAISPGAGAGEVAITIRGLTSAGGDPPGSSIPITAIPLLIDGVPQDRKELTRGGSVDLNSTEILKGPQSTNLGAESMDGAINLVTNDPAFEYQAHGQVEIGSYDLISTEGVANIPLSDTAAFRVAASTESRDGYISSDAGQEALTNARAKFRWQPNDDLNIVLTAALNRIAGDGTEGGILLAQGVWVPYSENPVPLTGCVPAGAGITSGGCSPAYSVLNNGTTYRTRSDPWNDGYPANLWVRTPYDDTTVTQVNALINWNLGFGVLTFQPSWQHTNYSATTSPRSNDGILEYFTQNTPQYELRLASPAGSPFEWLAGLYYHYSNRQNTFVNDFLPGGAPCPAISPTDCYTWSSDKYNHLSSTAAFGSFKYPILDSLRLIGGLRWSEDVESAVSDTAGLLGNPGTASGPLTPYAWVPEYRATFSQISYRGGLEYDVAPEIMVYAVTATGYQPGTISYSVFTNSVNTTPASSLTEYTLGLKSRFLQNRLQINLEAFDETTKDQAVSGGIVAQLPGATKLGANNCGLQPSPPGLAPPLVVDANGDCAVVPAGSATSTLQSKGVDLDLNFLLTRADQMALSAEYLTANYSSVPLIYGKALATTPGSILGAIATNREIPTANAAVNAAALSGVLASAIGGISGMTLDMAARWSASADYRHNFTLPGGSTLTPRLNFIYKSHYTSGLLTAIGDGYNPSLATQPGYAEYNVFCTWQNAAKKFSVIGYVKNIGNEAVLLNYGVTPPPATQTVTLDAPRTFGLILQARY
jgi:iron complex outermembrane recepter protein